MSDGRSRLTVLSPLFEPPTDNSTVKRDRRERYAVALIEHLGLDLDARTV